MDELFACTNSCALASFYTPATAHTLSDCFANFMREELSPSWPGINPLSQRAVCCQWLFINSPRVSQIVVSAKNRRRQAAEQLGSCLSSISIDHYITPPARLMDSCVLARKKTPVNHVDETYFIVQNVKREKAGSVSVGGTLNRRTRWKMGNSFDRRLEISRLLTTETPRF